MKSVKPSKTRKSYRRCDECHKRKAKIVLRFRECDCDPGEPKEVALCDYDCSTDVFFNRAYGRDINVNDVEVLDMDGNDIGVKVEYNH